MMGILVRNELVYQNYDHILGNELMQEQRCLQLDAVSTISALQQCESLPEGKRIHAVIARNGQWSNLYLGNLLVQIYRKCGALDFARQVFDRMDRRNVFSWNIMLSTYAQIGALQDAKWVFDKMPERDLVFWNSIIAAYSHHGHSLEAVQLFRKLITEGIAPDKITSASVVDACADLGILAKGRPIHAHIIEVGFQCDVRVGNALINMYGKCGSLTDACLIFKKLNYRSAVSWTSMISTLAQHGFMDEALEVFQDMQLEGMVPDEATFVSVLNACSEQSLITGGKLIHAETIRRQSHLSVVLGTSLIDMYGKCGELKEAKDVFIRLVRKNVITWTVMVGAYALYGLYKDAVQLFQEMQLEDMKPDNLIFGIILDACGTETALFEGMVLHAWIINNGFDSDTIVQTALLNMYGRCASMSSAQIVFDKMQLRDLVSWNAMIATYAQHGHGIECVKLFRSMQLQGLFPDAVTLLILLSACSHAGHMTEGCHYFTSMPHNHDVAPKEDHSNSLIDLLGRAKMLDEASDLINCIHCQPTTMSWMTLFSAYNMDIEELHPPTS